MIVGVLFIFLLIWMVRSTNRTDRTNKINRYNRYTHCLWCNKLYQVKNGSDHYCSLKCEKEHR